MKSYLHGAISMGDSILVPVSLLIAIGGAIFTFSKINTLTEMMTQEVGSIKTELTRLSAIHQDDVDKIRKESYGYRVRIYDQIDALRSQTVDNSVKLARIESKLDVMLERTIEKK